MENYLDVLATNYLRVTSAIEITKANSGHTGTSLGAAPIIFSLYKNALVDCKNPSFFNRDRIIFSAGHASPLFYACLHLFNFDLSIEDLKNFRKIGSKTPGHPEVNITPGIDCSSGPLGQGIANAVGFAIAEEFLKNKFAKGNLKPINHYTYCFTGDGCLMEGVAQEALSIAGNLKLSNLILLYDYNNITIEGEVGISNREDVKAKFLSMNFNVLEVLNGNNTSDIDESIKKAKLSDKPTVIIIKTKIGHGCELEGSNKIHGKPLSIEQIHNLRQNLSYFVPEFEIPQELREYIKKINEEKQKLLNSQKEDLDEYKRKFPNEYKTFLELENYFNFDLSSLISTEIKNDFDARAENHKLLNLIGEAIPNLIGGCGDVAPSTQAFFDNTEYFTYLNRTGRNIPYGIREHAMGAISNGISLHKGIRAFCSTFFCFANYLTPAIRMSALMNNPVLYIFTHDSLLTGEDGPTHQAIEQISTLRSMPNILNFRPCGKNELIMAYQTYFKNNNPVSIILPRLKTSFVLDDFEKAQYGAYIISQLKNPVATIIATGSEVTLAIDAQNLLKEKGINVNVVSMPCMEIFDKQDENYKLKILDKSKPIFCVEASNDPSFYKYATSRETIMQISTFGASGNPEEVYKHFGFTKENLAQKIENYLNKLN